MRSLLKPKYARCSGTESIHSLREESSSATICCSQCGPTNPRKIFDLLIEYYNELENSVKQHSRAAHDGPQRDGQDLDELDDRNKV